MPEKTRQTWCRRDFEVKAFFVSLNAINKARM